MTAMSARRDSLLLNPVGRPRHRQAASVLAPQRSSIGSIATGKQEFKPTGRTDSDRHSPARQVAWARNTKLAPDTSRERHGVGPPRGAPMSGSGAGPVVRQEQANARGRSQLSIHARARTQDTSRGSRGSHIIASSWEAGDRGRAPARKRRAGLAVDLPRGAAPHPGALRCEDVTTQGSGGPGRTSAAHAGRVGASAAPGICSAVGRVAAAPELPATRRPFARRTGWR